MAGKYYSFTTDPLVDPYVIQNTFFVPIHVYSRVSVCSQEPFAVHSPESNANCCGCKPPGTGQCGWLPLTRAVAAGPDHFFPTNGLLGFAN